MPVTDELRQLYTRRKIINADFIINISNLSCVNSLKFTDDLIIFIFHTHEINVSQ
jgi:hypothetical protein